METELLVDRMAVGGDGIARASDGRVVFVSGALPGERVRVRVTQQKRDFWRAEVVGIVDGHRFRVVPPCPEVVRGCGGCSWMHIDPAAQLTLKVHIVRDALARQGGLAEAEVHAGRSLAAVRYRTTARFAGDEQGRLGLRRSASHSVLPLDDCLVTHQGIAEILPEARITPGAEVTLRVSEHTGERTAMLADGDRSGTSTTRARIEVLPPDVQRGARASLTERVAGADLRVSAASFFQSSAASATLLVQAVAAALEPRDNVRRWVDLYAGIGLFAASVLPEADVVAVEQSPSACDDARHNLAGRAAVVVEGDVEHWTPMAADAVVADPARRGLGGRGVDAGAGTGAPVVVLVSCDAASLGRDAALLRSRGYSHRGSTVLDLFPGTPHVEVVTRFVRDAR